MKTLRIPHMLTISWLRENYKKQGLTPEEVIQEAIHRAEEDAGMNIWITPPTWERIQPYLDRLKTLDPDRSPLWGIPFAIKDNIDLAEVPTTAGCPDYAYTPDVHATVVERLVAAGAIPLGKTNLDQFATGLVGTRSPYGEVHNALREELISGGSSSGSAVAVARGHAAFALGTDTAGSGRVPAALNRLIGYKPSLGAWSTKGVVPACASLDCVTVFTHTLEDALAVDDVVRGFDEKDPWSMYVPRLTSKLPQKICLPKEMPVFFGPFADVYRHAWEKTVERWKQLNLPVEYVDTNIFAKAASILYEGPWVAERWADLENFVENHPGSVFPVTEQVLRTGTAVDYTAASLFQAIHRLQMYRKETQKMLRNAVLVMPTSGGTWTREQVRQNPLATNSEMGRYTNHANLLGLCAVAVPSADADQDLPFGITLFALSGHEDLMIGAADLFLGNNLVQTGGFVDCREKTTLVAVCGLHMRGYPLEEQMIALGARFIREAATAAKYQMIKLPTIPAKPGLIKRTNGGASIKLELWEISVSALGELITTVPAPLGIGKIELADGTEVPGFVCEAYAAEISEDITALRGWRNR